MKTKWLISTMVILIVLLFTAPPCWAKAKGYCFIVGYSYKIKKLFYTPIFMVKVRNVSYSDTEYVAEVALIRMMESQLQSHLENNALANPSEFTFAARGAYKNQNFAAQSLTKEKEEYAKKGFELVDLTDFKFKK